MNIIRISLKGTTKKPIKGIYKIPHKQSSDRINIIMNG